eukprot:CAMPEP_0185798886 /NCGR_PEP_ID=MMETSP1174-20130828/162387_1 /TAXON_ID=35687 /ORGANISM="Dictyocha speculum, Strain CCMP1381" /LENGTH=391 /DNA_ID=CAMNT_0028494413 /DNA_START=378 /DNA_END=1550 /DNA_ORIENTATION=+
MFENVLVGENKVKAVGHPKAYVCHPWNAQLEDTLSAVEAFCETCMIDIEDYYIWIDVFCIDHNAPKMSEVNKARSILATMREVESMLCFCETMVDLPETFTRAWCLWEMYASLISGAKFEVVLTPGRKRELKHKLKHDFKSTLDLTAHIKCDLAEADPMDKKMIRKWIKSGLPELNLPSVGDKAMTEILQTMVHEWIKSSDGKFQISINFVNNNPNKGNVEIRWVNPVGQVGDEKNLPEKPYANLKPGHQYIQNGYAAHTWRIYDEANVRLKEFVGHCGVDYYDVEAYDTASSDIEIPINVAFINALPAGDNPIEIRLVGPTSDKENVCASLMPGHHFIQKTYCNHVWNLYYPAGHGADAELLASFVGRDYDRQTHYNVTVCCDETKKRFW